MEIAKPNIEELSDLITKAESLKQALVNFREKTFLTATQHEAIKAGSAKDIALYLLRLNKSDETKYLSNFCEIDSLFEDSANPYRPSSCRPGIFIKTKKGFELYQGEAPVSHRYCFNIGALQEFLEQYTAKEKKDYWNKYIQHDQYRLWNRLRRWRRFIKFNTRTDIIEIVDNLKIETLNKKTLENLEDAIFEFRKIKADILDSLTDKLPINDNNLKARFSFAPGQVLFDGKDLKLPTGNVVDIFHKLFDNIGKTVPYETFDKYYSSATPGPLPKNISKIRKILKQNNIPCEITSKTGEGYLLIQSSPKKKRVRIK